MGWLEVYRAVGVHGAVLGLDCRGVYWAVFRYNVLSWDILDCLRLYCMRWLGVCGAVGVYEAVLDYSGLS